MKIAYITHYYPPSGGAGSINTYEIVKRLARKHKVTVFTVSTYSKYLRMEQEDEKVYCCYDANLKVYRSPPVPLLLSVTFSHLVNLKKLFEEDFDVVMSQYHSFHFASFIGFLAKFVKMRPWVIKVHDLVLDPKIRAFYERTYLYFQYGLHVNFVNKYADRVLVTCSELRDFLFEGKPYSPGRIAVVPNGVDTTLFHPQRNGEGGEEKTIIYTGSMSPEDGLDILVKAFSLLSTKSGLRLLLVGDGPERNKLLRMVVRLGLEKYVTFHTYVPHELMTDIVRASYLAIGPLYPSSINYLTIPTKILEYFACGVPVVSCKVSSDVLTDNITGLSVRDPTPENVAEKIELLVNDENLVKRLGANARELVKKKFDWEVVIRALEKELFEVLRSS